MLWFLFVIAFWYWTLTCLVRKRLVFAHFFDLVLALGRYSWDSSSRPFCLLYQSNRVLRMDGRQYSAKELIELIN